jgi:hypothetical protein
VVIASAIDGHRYDGLHEGPGQFNKGDTAPVKVLREGQEEVMTGDVLIRRSASRIDAGSAPVGSTHQVDHWGSARPYPAQQRTSPTMSTAQRIAVIGAGSWGTALVKLLSSNAETRWAGGCAARDHRTHQGKYGHNPDYISAAQFDGERLAMDSDIHAVVKRCRCAGDRCTQRLLEGHHGPARPRRA